MTRDDNRLRTGRRRLPFVFAALAMLCGIVASAGADTRLVYTGTDNPYIVRVRPDAVRIDTGTGRWQLYIKQTDTLFTVSPGQRSYSRLDNATATAIHDKLQALRKKIEQQLERMPLEQRQAARAALAEQLPGFTGQPRQPSVYITGHTDRVAGIACDKVKIKYGQEVRWKACIASAPDLGMSSTEYNTLMAMFRLMDAMVAGTGYAATSLPYTKLQGLPVRLYSTQADASRSLTAVSRKPLPQALFVIPPAFTEVEHLQ